MLCAMPSLSSFKVVDMMVSAGLNNVKVWV